MNILFSTQQICAPSNAVKVDPKKDINYYETLCLFCSENDIDLSNVSDADFSSHVTALAQFGYDFTGPSSVFWFWVEE